MTTKIETTKPAPKKNKSKKPAPKKNKSKKPAKRKGVSIAFPSTHHNGVSFSKTRPGVLAIILGMLRSASKKNPVTKAQIVEALVEQFPERDETKMKRTVGMQVPSQLLTEKQIVVKRAVIESGANEGKKGYWVE